MAPRTLRRLRQAAAYFITTRHRGIFGRSEINRHSAPARKAIQASSWWHSQAARHIARAARGAICEARSRRASSAASPANQRQLKSRKPSGLNRQLTRQITSLTASRISPAEIVASWRNHAEIAPINAKYSSKTRPILRARSAIARRNRLARSGQPNRRARKLSALSLDSGAEIKCARAKRNSSNS